MPEPHVYGYRHGIPGWYYCDEFYKKIVADAEDGETFVEVGVHFGSSCAGMAQRIKDSGKNIEFYMVDTFEDHPKNYGIEGHRIIRQYGRGNFRATFDFFRMGAPHEADFCKLYIADTFVAAAGFADESLDLVYLDDDHSYDHVLAELNAWWPKLKMGGIIAADYELAEPFMAVQNFALEEFKIFEDSVWYVMRV